MRGQFATSRKAVRRRYRAYVCEGVGDSWQGLRQWIYLRDEASVARMQGAVRVEGDRLSVPQAQRRPPAPTLAQIAARSEGRDAAIVAAYATDAYTYREIADYFGIHLATVGRIVRGGMK